MTVIYAHCAFINKPAKRRKGDTNMKNFLSMALTVVILATMVLGFTAIAAEGKTEVFVTIANGSLAVTHEKINVTDTDGDGKLTINDALKLTHDAKYDGGSAAGYGSVSSEWGLSLTKLWGVENGGSYGYFVNNTFASALDNEIKHGDYIVAFVYTDTNAFSDSYTWFDSVETTANENGEVTLTLSCGGYDENFSFVTNPLVGAKITLDGKDTGLITDSDGKVTIKAGNAGEYLISAASDTKLIVPPVGILTVKGATPDTGDSIVTVMIIVGAVALVGVAAVIFGRKRRI